MSIKNNLYFKIVRVIVSMLEDECIQYIMNG